MSWMAALGSAAGNVLGSFASTGLQYYLNKDLMNHANNLNRDNLRKGPSIQRQGLEAAGYNPLLALSGYTSGLPNVSPMSVSQPDMSNLGSSAMSAHKAMAEADTEKERKDVVKASLDVKKAESSDLKKSAELKDALKEKADADATKTKVETFTEPARVVSSVLGAGATAYGAKKVHDLFKKKNVLSSLEKERVKAQRKRIDTLYKWTKDLERRMSPSPIKSFFPYSPYALAALVFSASSAKATKTIMNDAHREGHWIDKHGIERNPKWIYGGVPIVP